MSRLTSAIRMSGAAFVVGLGALGLGAAVTSGLPASAQQASASTPAAPASAPQAPANAPAADGQFKPTATKGFIARDKLVDSLALLPPPPAAGSAAFSEDDEARKAAIQFRETPRWKLAARDADYKSPRVVDIFACTVGVNISEEATPHLYTLLRRSLIDAGLATYKAKIHYNRTRPFVVAKDSNICSPEEADFLSKDGSYPSGHSAFGWAWALILTEMVPDKADAIIQRGYQFGQNRVQCGVHWQSDVNAGRVVASAVVAQLHANPDFITEFHAAQKEVDAARAANKPGPDCTLEKLVVETRATK